MKAIRTKKEYTALFTAFIFSLSIFISLIYVVKASDHKCTHENCTVCASISRVLNMIKENLPHSEKPVIKSAFCFVAVFLLSLNGFLIIRKTPVSEKIRIEC